MTGYDKVKKNDMWLLSMFDARHQYGYTNVAWLIIRWMKRKGAGIQKESQISCGQFILKITRKSMVLTNDVVRSLSALIYCRDLDTTPLRDLIDSESKLIPEDPQLGVPRVGIPRPPRATMQDLYDRMGRMEIRREAIKRMKYRQSYHWDRDQKYEWGVEQEEAFQTLKDNLCNAPIYLLPDISEDFVVYCDKSNQGLGCVLMQRGKSSVKDKILAAPDEASKVENATTEMLRGLDQLIEMKEDGVDRLTKSAHFLAIREDYKMEKLARLYTDEIVPGHGVPMSIISDRDGRFTSRFNFRRTSLTGFPAQSARSSNAYVLDSPYLLVLNIGTSQSRQHNMSESDSYYISE
ncbi:reverse transcriptase domain-containing protein [Tanacetum coccineum]